MKKITILFVLITVLALIGGVDGASCVAHGRDPSSAVHFDYSTSGSPAWITFLNWRSPGWSSDTCYSVSSGIASNRSCDATGNYVYPWGVNCVSDGGVLVCGIFKISDTSCLVTPTPTPTPAHCGYDQCSKISNTTTYNACVACNGPVYCDSLCPGSAHGGFDSCAALNAKARYYGGSGTPNYTSAYNECIAYNGASYCNTLCAAPTPAPTNCTSGPIIAYNTQLLTSGYTSADTYDLSKDLTVYGRFDSEHPENSYVTIADLLGANRFSIPNAQWEAMTEAEQQAANERFQRIDALSHMIRGTRMMSLQPEPTDVSDPNWGTKFHDETIYFKDTFQGTIEKVSKLFTNPETGYTSQGYEWYVPEYHVNGAVVPMEEMTGQTLVTVDANGKVYSYVVAPMYDIPIEEIPVERFMGCGGLWRLP